MSEQRALKILDKFYAERPVCRRMTASHLPGHVENQLPPRLADA